MANLWLQLAVRAKLYSMNVLGVDVGKKRTGLAWIDTAIGVILPYGVIESSGNEVITALEKYITEEKIEAIVFGLPLNNEGEETDACRDIRLLGNAIQQKMHVEVAYEDERFSSRLGDAMGGDATRDEKAAMAILDTYIQKRKK